MQRKSVINKIIITEEAKQDFLDTTNCVIQPSEIKREIEDYIDNFCSCGRLCYSHYFRVKYYIEKIDKYLMLFFYRDKKFANMQMWKMAGVCLYQDWNEEIEESGQIRNWLKSKTEDLADDDWVALIRTQNEEKEKLLKEFS